MANPNDENGFQQLSEHEQQAMVIVNAVTGAMSATLALLGEKMGLFKALAEGGPITPEELATRLGLNVRYVAEWCRQQAASKFISTDQSASRFWLSEVQKDVLVREHGADASPFFQMGILTGLPDFNRIAQHELPRIFKTGEGLEYDQLGDQTACGVCRELGVWLRHALVPSIKTMPSVAEKLEQGCLVADVGCGAGVAMFVAAEAFPASTFHGFDISEKALALARAEKERRGCKNVEFFNPSLDEDRMGTDKYDFVMTHDAIHDMAHPQQVMENVHKAMKPGAEWIIGDMSSLEDHGQNIHNHPFSANLYGFSCLCCLPSGMSAPGAAGLGTMGLSISLAEKMLKTAGFKDFKVLEWTHPLNRYYVAVA